MEFISAKIYSSQQVETTIPGSYNVKKGDGPDVLADQVAVKVTLRLKNPNQVPFKLESMSNFMVARYGSSQYDAEGVTWAGDNIFAMDPTPNQIGAITSTDVWATYKVPKAELSTLTITPSVGAPSEVAFTDVGKVAS